MMPSHLHSFLFDINYNFGDESVFTLKNDSEGSPVPPSDEPMVYLDDDSMSYLDDDVMVYL